LEDYDNIETDLPSDLGTGASARPEMHLFLRDLGKLSQSWGWYGSTLRVEGAKAEMELDIKERFIFARIILEDLLRLGQYSVGRCEPGTMWAEGRKEFIRGLVGTCQNLQRIGIYGEVGAEAALKRLRWDKNDIVGRERERVLWFPWFEVVNGEPGGGDGM
jgi:hypothetical protein